MISCSCAMFVPEMIQDRYQNVPKPMSPRSWPAKRKQRIIVSEHLHFDETHCFHDIYAGSSIARDRTGKAVDSSGVCQNALRFRGHALEESAGY